jgi:hypothetical protein
MKNLENKTNSELELIKKQKIEEFYKVKQQIIGLYDYWNKVESDYKSITEVLNKRNINGR